MEQATTAPLLSYLSVRPYPQQYVSATTLKDGTAVIIRPIRTTDEPMMVKFHETLSDRTVYLRYFHSMSLDRRVAHARLVHICDCDYEKEVVLVAEIPGSAALGGEIVGVGRLNRLAEATRAEVAVVISDHYQGKGLGFAFLTRLVEIARGENISRLEGEILHDNLAMQILMKRLGFQLRMGDDPTSVQAVLALQP